MYPDWVLPAGLMAVFIWLGGLTYLFWKQGDFLKSLFPKSGERDIRRKFEEVIEEVKGFKGDLGKLEEKASKLDLDGMGHIQRIKLLRYNPYEDTGGNISFTLALLDDKGNGIVITSLHARSGTRLFAKPVKDGKSSTELSKEEQKAVKEALI